MHFSALVYRWEPLVFLNLTNAELESYCLSTEAADTCNSSTVPPPNQQCNITTLCRILLLTAFLSEDSCSKLSEVILGRGTMISSRCVSSHPTQPINFVSEVDWY